MKKPFALLLSVLLLCALLAGCGGKEVSSPGEAGATGAPPQSTALDTDALLASYYLSEQHPAHAYLQNSSIQKFLDMWLDEYMGEETEAEWDYSSIAPVSLLDQDFASLQDEDDAPLYTLLFTTVKGETGYIIVAYNEGDPSIQQWSLHESTPHRYDLRANLEPILAALAETDLDFASTTATRAEWIDTENNRGDRIILLQDATGGRYVCTLGGDDFSLEQQ